MDISCFQVQQWSYATIWVILAQCTSQKERRRSNAKLSQKADSRKMDEADLPFRSCALSCVPEGVTHVQTGIHPKWLTAQPVLPLPLHLQCGLCVKKRSTEYNFQEIILFLLQTFMFRRGFKVQMYTFFDSPLCFLWSSVSRPRPQRRAKKPLIVKGAFQVLWEYLASCFKEKCINEVQHERSLGLSDTRLQLYQIYHLSWLGLHNFIVTHNLFMHFDRNAIYKSEIYKQKK